MTTLALYNSGAIDVPSSSATPTALEGDLIVQPTKGYGTLTKPAEWDIPLVGDPIYVGRHEAVTTTKKIAAILNTTSERIGTIGTRAGAHVVLSAKKFRKSLAGIATQVVAGSRVVMKKAVAARHALCRGLVYDVPPQLTPEQFAALGPTAREMCKRHFAGMGLEPTTA